MRLILYFLLGMFLTLPPANAESRSGESNSPVDNFITITPEKFDRLAGWHDEAEKLMGRNDCRGAIRVYETILLEEPDDETAYAQMGRAYQIVGDFGRAKEAYLNALHINPENQAAVYGLRKIMDPDGAPDPETEF